MTTDSSWLNGLYGNPVEDGTRVGTFLAWDGTDWVESYSLSIPGGADRTIGVASTSSGAGSELTIQGQNTTAAGATGGALTLRSGSGGSGGRAGYLTLMAGGSSLFEGNATSVSVMAPTGGTLYLVDGSGNAMVGVGDDGQVGFFGTAPVHQPAVNLSTVTANDIANALISLGLFREA